jgi:hypothetical protein
VSVLSRSVVGLRNGGMTLAYRGDSSSREIGGVEHPHDPSMRRLSSDEVLWEYSMAIRMSQRP